MLLTVATGMPTVASTATTTEATTTVTAREAKVKGHTVT
jgi:hypothetical protein